MLACSAPGVAVAAAAAAAAMSGGAGADSAAAPSGVLPAHDRSGQR